MLHLVGTDCSPGSDVVIVVQFQRPYCNIEIVRALIWLERCDLCVTQCAEHSMCGMRV